MHFFQWRHRLPPASGSCHEGQILPGPFRGMREIPYCGFLRQRSGSLESDACRNRQGGQNSPGQLFRAWRFCNGLTIFCPLYFSRASLRKQYQKCITVRIFDSPSCLLNISANKLFHYFVAFFIQKCVVSAAHVGLICHCVCLPDEASHGNPPFALNNKRIGMEDAY